MSLGKMATVDGYGLDDTLRIMQSDKREQAIEVMVIDNTEGRYTTIVIDKSQLAWLAKQFPVEEES